MDANYSVEISECSKELTAKERVMFKDLGNALSMIDYAKQCEEEGAKAIIDYADYVVVHVHNDKGEDKDYTNYILIDKTGGKFYTGSVPFCNAFKNSKHNFSPLF